MKRICRNSRLGTFDGCPRKYYYLYLAEIKLEQRLAGIEAFLGLRAHDVKQEYTPGDYR